MDLVEMTYALTAVLPRDEMFGLSSQVRRAAVSVPSNIAEGHARESTREFLRFLLTARGSLAELETQLSVCVRLKYVSEVDVAPAFKLADDIGRMIRGLQHSLEAKLDKKP